jgi:queuine tRNA-ribosyltransferase
MKKKFRFEIKNRDNKARQGLISTPRGDIKTPAFMPVGTAATVKGIFQKMCFQLVLIFC